MCRWTAKGRHSSVLAWRIPGTGEPGGLPSMGSHMTKATAVAAAGMCVCVCVCYYMMVTPARKRQSDRRLVGLLLSRSGGGGFRCLLYFFLHEIFKSIIKYLKISHRSIIIVYQGYAYGHYKRMAWDFFGGPGVWNPPANAGDTGLIPGPGRSHVWLSS